VGIATLIAAKYYPAFARRLERIFKENLPNRFSEQRIRDYYKDFPALAESLVKENTPKYRIT
jgi:glycerol-1-phosphate dehydrogenase [NAD(P)+]